MSIEQPLDPPVKTAVLLIGFKRAKETRRVLEAIRSARPPRLYFACDGPRNEDERVQCGEVRALVDLVDWDCQVHTRFNEQNVGLRKGVSSAIEWFFSQEPEGIVLEDDTLPVTTFFRFCEEMLERYRNDPRIWVIMGNNLMLDWPRQGNDSYYFSAHGYGAPWGWASWRRVWDHYDVDMKLWPELKRSSLLKDFFLNKDEERDVHGMFDYVHQGTMNSWSYQLDVTRIMNHGLNILPNTNLVRNIGFGAGSTHTMDENDPRNQDTAKDITFPLEHPRFIMLDAQRDAEYFKRYIGSTAFQRTKERVKRMLGGDNGMVMRTWMSMKGKDGLHG